MDSLPSFVAPFIIPLHSEVVGGGGGGGGGYTGFINIY